MLVCLLNNRDSTWRDKLAEFLPSLNVTSDWDEFKKLPSPRLFLVHFEALPKIIDKLAKYKKLTWACIDEAHRIANRGTKQSRAAGRLSWVPHKLILTGTPIEKEPTNLFAQFRFLSPDVFGTNWEAFEKRYLEWPELPPADRVRGAAAWQARILQQRILRGRATFRQARMPEFVKLIKPYGWRLTKEDMGIKAPKITQVVVPLDRLTAGVYKELNKKRVIDRPGRWRATADLPGVLVGKRRQLASGFLFDDDGETHWFGKSKLTRLLTMVDQARKPVVVFTAWRPDFDRVTRALRRAGYNVAAVNGLTKKSDRPEAWRRFQQAEFDVIVCAGKVGGAGVDLWKANTGIIHSMGHSSIDFEQITSRLDSVDKTSAAEFFVLCSEGTVDMDLYDLVILKKSNANTVLNQLRRRSS